jgi:hypothetical protein
MDYKRLAIISSSITNDVYICFSLQQWMASHESRVNYFALKVEKMCVWEACGKPSNETLV